MTSIARNASPTDGHSFWHRGCRCAPGLAVPRGLFLLKIKAIVQRNAPRNSALKTLRLTCLAGLWLQTIVPPPYSAIC